MKVLTSWQTRFKIGLTMNTVYRIYTEDTNLDGITGLADKVLGSKGYSVFRGVGRWREQTERSIVVEFIGSQEQADLIDSLARDIKVLNNQQAVLVASLPVSSKLV